MTIFDINAEIEALIDPETGEITDYEALEALDIQREEKLESMALIYKEYMIEVKALKEQAEIFTAKAKAKENAGKRIKELLDQNLNGEKLKTLKVNAYYTTHEATKFDDKATFLQWAIDNKVDAFVKVHEPELAVDAVKQFIKGGGTVEGAWIEQTSTLTIK